MASKQKTSKPASTPSDESPSPITSRRTAFSVSPGQLLVKQADSFALQAVEDREYKPDLQRVFGVALWHGSESPIRGYPLVITPIGATYVPLITGDSRRPMTGIGLIDAWITRADALRKLRAGGLESFGPISISEEDLLEGILSIEKRVRSSAQDLLSEIPTDHPEVTNALSAVLDSKHPSVMELTRVLQSLPVAACQWCGHVSDGESAESKGRRVSIFGGFEEKSNSKPSQVYRQAAWFQELPGGGPKVNTLRVARIRGQLKRWFIKLKRYYYEIEEVCDRYPDYAADIRAAVAESWYPVLRKRRRSANA